MANPFDQFDQAPAAQGNPFDQFDPGPPQPPPTGFWGGMAATLSGMGKNLSAGMQGTSPSTGDKQLIGEYALTDAGHDVKLPTGQYRSIDPTREVVLVDPATNKQMVYARDVPVNSLSGRADAAGRILGVGALSAAPQGINAATAATKAASAVDTMRNAGVKLTPGQTVGGVAQRVEDKITSIPGLGDLVNNARRGGMESFNVATGNKVLEPIKQTVEKGTVAGRGLIAEVGDKISSAYENLLPKLKLQTDDALMTDLANIETGLAPEMAKTFTQKVTQKLIGRFDSDALTGEALKKAESEMSQLASSYSKSAMASERELGQAFGEAKTALREALARTNPEHAQELQDINRAYAMLLRMENAGAAAGSKEGVFTPAALRAATKAKDTSRNKKAFARGDALLQPWAESGESVLGSTYPDSGTAGRMLQALMLGGGAGYVEPTTLAVGAGAALPYMPYVRPAVNGLLGQGPALRQSLPGAGGLLGIGAKDQRRLAGR